MPSNAWKVGSAIAVLAVAVYSVFVAAELLLGALTTALVYLLARVVGRDGLDGFFVASGRRRAAVAGAFALATVAYGTLVGRLLVGVVVGSTVLLAVWLTGPAGPLARGYRWLREARADLRAVRRAVEADAPPEAPDD
jgi:hypothetical protein